MIGEIRKIITSYFDIMQEKKLFKFRPALIIAKADANDYIVLPISRVTRKENLHPVYDIKIEPSRFPKLNLSSVSYVRTHKQTVVHIAEISTLYGSIKDCYEELYLEILEKREQFSQEITNQALGKPLP
nr:MAG TPA: endoribonuclease [Caudoviricetes sp.]